MSTSTKVRCDLCGREEEADEGGGVVLRDWARLDFRTSGVGRDIDLDFCPDCETEARRRVYAVAISA